MPGVELGHPPGRRLVGLLAERLVLLALRRADRLGLAPGLVEGGPRLGARLLGVAQRRGAERVRLEAGLLAGRPGRRVGRRADALRVRLRRLRRLVGRGLRRLGERLRLGLRVPYQGLVLGLGELQDAAGPLAQGVVTLRGERGDGLAQPGGLRRHLLGEDRQARRALPRAVAFLGERGQVAVDLLRAVTAPPSDGETHA